MISDGWRALAWVSDDVLIPDVPCRLGKMQEDGSATEECKTSDGSGWGIRDITGSALDYRCRLQNI